MNERHKSMLRDAADALIAVADDSGTSLVDVLAEVERYAIEETKVGGDAPPGRRGYRLVPRLVEKVADAEQRRILDAYVKAHE